MKEFMVKKLLFTGFALLLLVNVVAQKTASYEPVSSLYKSGLDLYSKGQYGAALKVFEKTIQKIDNTNSSTQISAEYYKALCSIELFHDDAEIQLKEFLLNHPENPNAEYVYYHLGRFQFRKHEYKSVVSSFKNVDLYALSSDERIEYNFKFGYSLFCLDSLSEAKRYLAEVLKTENKYKPSAQYYYSHIAYAEGNYQTALNGFLSLKDNETFKELIPYYVTHIYYLQEKYSELINTAQSLLQNSTPKRKPEIARLIGEAYYRTNDYEKSVPYLEQYHSSSGTNPSLVDQYQLGYAYYKTQQYQKAIDKFKHLAFTNDSLAQNANYHLAYCYYNMDEKLYALNAFQQAFQINLIANITEDALYNFAKLSYELDYNPYNQAIDAFQKYVSNYPKASHRQEAMAYLSKMYLSTKNYEKALVSIEQIPNKSPELLSAYQRILYARGIEMFTQSDYNAAIDFYSKSIAVNKERKVTAQALYWKAESYYQLANYAQSIKYFDAFLEQPGAIQLPEFYLANYQIAYANFKLKNYTNALTSFRVFEKNYLTKDEFLNDAYLRIGDCYYIAKQFDDAIENYDKALAIGKKSVDYALYQKAQSYGPLGQFQMKASTLKSLIDNYPKSDYVGNAEFELAETYFKALDNKAEALRYYDQIIQKYSKEKAIVKRAMLSKGLLYNNMDKDEEALAAFKLVAQNYKGTEESKEALKAIRSIYIEQNKADEFFKLSEQLGEKISANEMDSVTYFAAENVYMKNDCQKSSQYFFDYIDRYPDGAFIINARYYLADCQFRASSFDQALQNYLFINQKPINQFSENALAQTAYIYFDKKKDYDNALVSFTKLIAIAEYKSNLNIGKLGKLKCLWNLSSYGECLNYSEEVISISGLDEADKIDALLIKAKAAMKLGKDSIAEDAFNVVISKTKTESSAEARYNLALIAFNQKKLSKAESLTFDVIEQVPSYEYWVVKSFILSSDIFVETGNLYQAKATLNSVIEVYEGDEGIINEAKGKLAAIIAKEKAELKPNKEPEILLNMGTENKLFEEKETPKEEKE